MTRANDEIDVHDSAGIVLRAPDGKVLFLKRGPTANHAGEWDWPGGHVQAGETLMEGAIRETHEESGYRADPADLHELSRKISGDIDFTAYICPVTEKFTPDLERDEDGGREHDDFIWADLRDLPEPLHPSIKEALSDDFVDEIIEAGSASVTVAEDSAWDALTLALDAEWSEGDHPRAKNGEFGAGGSGAAKAAKPKLSPTEKSYVSSYTDDAFFETNKKLRDGGDADAMVKSIDSAIGKSTLPAGTRLYRGMSKEALISMIGGRDLKAGQVISDKAFLSASEDKNIAMMSGGMGGVVLDIETAEGQPGLNLTELGRNPHEKEVLLPRNTKLQIAGIVAPKAVGDPIRVRVKTVPDSNGAEDAGWDAITTAMDAIMRPESLLALDKASVRTYDADGRLHVALTPISREMICPYMGSEIPGWEQDNLDPRKIYRLLRPGDELEKGAASSNGLPLLRQHQATNADDHPSDIVIGALGNDAIFQDGMLWNSITVWVAEDIEGIESGEKYQISASYRYVPDWTPGTWRGEHYDGIMRGPPEGPGGFIFNHAAIVVDGRCGVRVSVADSFEDDVKWALVEEAVVAMTR